MLPHRHRTACLAYVVLLATALSAAAGAEYVVAPTGDDSRDGSAAAPWRTLERSVSALTPGDGLTLRGGRYAESLVIPLQARADRPIRVRAAAGETPVIDGADPLTGWHELTPGIWAVAAPADAVLGRGLLLNGEQPLLEAAWPAGSTDPFGAVTVPATITDSTVTIASLPPGAWQGALVFGVAGWGWGAQAGRITAVAGTTLSVAPVAEGAWFTGTARVRILGGAAPLMPGTWTLAGGRILACPPPGVAAAALRWVVRPYGVDLGGARHVSVNGLRLVGSTIVTFDAEGCTISDCDVVWPDRNWLVQPYAQDGGIRLAGTGNRLVGCSVTGSTGTGISVSGRRHTVEHCRVRDVDTAGTYAAGLLIGGDGHRISTTTIDGCGRDGVHLDHTAPGHRLIDGLDVGRVGLVARDCGALYAWGQDGMGTVISHCWFHDNRAESAGPLVYFDDDAHGFILTRIVTWNSRVLDAAVRLNGGVHDVTIAHVTSFDCAPIGANMYLAEGRAPPTFRVVNVAAIAHPQTDLADPTHRDFRPASGNRTLVDAGARDPLSGEIAGSAADLGAYEAGMPYWRPGAP